LAKPRKPKELLATVGLYVSIFNLFTSLLSLFGFGSSGE
jgi:modulator of FtsH protease